MNAIIYVNAPLLKDEHDALVRIAAKEGRSKGQQLRLLAVRAMTITTRKPKGGKP